MLSEIYNPIERFSFVYDLCFLTGEKLENPDIEYVDVFPKWLLERYDMLEKKIQMLGGNKMRYVDMRLPASPKVRKAIAKLDETTRKAFEEGYEAVKKLPELTLFQWMGRVLYGVVFQDFTYAIGRAISRDKQFKLSGLMSQRIKNLHLMLQSLIHPVEFDGFKPWSMKIYQVKISRDILNYEDETHTLSFLLGMNGFAVAACLQDNGEVGEHLKFITDKIADDTVLHPIQFQELYGRFNYGSYLLRQWPDYIISQKEDGTIVFKLPELTEKDYPRFGEWEDKIYAQVMANLWLPWGIALEKIWVFPNSPMSYLLNDTTNEFIPPEEVKLPF